MSDAGHGSTGAERGVLVVSAHAGDFVWRAAGAIAGTVRRGEPATIVCLSFGERGESAKSWRDGLSLDAIKAQRRAEAEAAAAALGADIRFFDLGDYPLEISPEAVDRMVHVYREVRPAVVLTHPLTDPYNVDHPRAARLALDARILAQAVGYDAPGDPIGAPPVFFFEPHQPEQSDFKPNVLLDITEDYPAKEAAMRCLPAQQHMWDYYADLATRRGVQVRRNAGPNLGLPSNTKGEAYVRSYPQVTDVLA
jgi:4-oxalomesaconate hydratase